MKHQNNIKVISGKFKKMKIKILKNKNIRPTLGIIRKKLFNWLHPFIKNKICLDCFSGSGILSIESLSLNASHVTIIEKNYKIIKNIKNNLYLINKDKFKLINLNIFNYLKNYPKKFFDIVFIDPPYKNNYINKLINILEEKKWIKKNSYIYIEKKKKINTLNIPKNWNLYKKINKSNNQYFLFKKKKS